MNVEAGDAQGLFHRLAQALGMRGPAERGGEGEFVLAAPTIAANGRMALLESAPRKPSEVYAFDAGKLRALSHHNDDWLKDIDFGQLTGHGVSTGATYTAGGLMTLTRVLSPNDVIEATLPFAISGSAPTDAFRTAVARFNFKFNISNGSITAVTASVAASTL